ncbi:MULTISPECIES: type IV secretory system conjugative DNA transfer family protein [Microvirga]|uniref:type IV secretory system conjugative DNA transfer family protein n=1 Tax=Microvirga TaxID=186650 RepID=UPI0021C5FC2F|nr:MULTISPECIES: type IV secretory system conjugative DNA transfer family protein [unclassified Microvirga]
MKLHNPLKTEYLPEHMTESQRKHYRWLGITAAIGLPLAAGTTLCTPLFRWLIDQPLNQRTLDGVGAFVGRVAGGDILSMNYAFVVSPNYGGFDALKAYLGVAFVSTVVYMAPALLNPYLRQVMKGGFADWCDDETLGEMEAREQVGIKGGHLMALGRWPKGPRKGQMVMMIETLSALCLAPPGTGKTAAFVVPTLLKGDNVSFIVNDPKPELYEMTGHYRSTVSHVFMLNWAKVDEPNYILTFDTNKTGPFWDVFLELYGKGTKGQIPEELVVGYKAREVAGGKEGTFEASVAPTRIKFVKDWVNERDGAGVYTVRDPVFYPRFNFLSPKLVPPQGPDRDTYLDTVAKTLIPNPDGGKGNDYFVTKGRAALTGFMHYLISKVGDKKNYDGLPAKWNGYEPSIPMLSDWLAVSQFESTKKTGDEDPMAAMGADKMGDWIRTLCDDVVPAEQGGKFPSPRAFVELSSLVNMADKERSGVFGTMDQALLPFKNAAVAQRTSACDFTPDDMRGMKAPGSDEIKPVTLYICVNQAEAGAFETVTALLYEVFSQSLISYGPGEFNHKTGNELGPFPVCFALDEFAKLPRIESVITGPDLGRSKKVSYLLAAQDFGQIRKKYTAEDESVIITTTAVKYVLAQNNTDTIDKFKKMVGETTIQRAQKTYNEGLSKSANPMAWSRSEQIENISFLRNEDVASLKPGKNIVLVQNFLNRPMKLDTPYFFKDKEMAEKVRSRGKGPIATQTIPDFILKDRLNAVDPAEAAKRKAGRLRRERDDQDTRHLTPEVVAYEG